MTTRTTVGVVLSLLAGVCLSTGGIALRLVESADGFQILVYRALTFVALMLVFIVLTYQRRTFTVVYSIGRAGLLVALMRGLGPIFCVLAILHTTVANSVVILSTSSLLTDSLPAGSQACLLRSPQQVALPPCWSHCNAYVAAT